MMIEHVSLVEMVKDERGEHKYIYKAFRYDDTNCSIFFTNYKYLFNINSDYLRIRIMLVLMYRMVDNRIIYEQQEY